MAGTNRADAPRGRLPAPVAAYVERALPAGDGGATQVRIAQEGRMWQRPGGRELRFTASQVFAVERVAFCWLARFPIAGPLAIRVVDAYEGGAGRLVARLAGLPVQRQRGRETTIGEAMRYLAELPWMPPAFMRNPELEWRQLDGGRIEVATHAGGERVAVELVFDAAGDVVRVTAAARPRQVGKGWAPTPWTGEFRAYERLGGVRVPTEAEVRWELPEGPFTYWRGTVTSLELLGGELR